MNVQRNIESIRQQICDMANRMAWLVKHREALEACPVEGGFFQGVFDFDRMPHDAVIQVIQTFGGKWDKTPSTGADTPRIDYMTIFDGVIVRCWHGEPPPSCKIVEVEEVIPAQPETKRMVKKMVCVETQEAATEPASQTATPEANEAVPEIAAEKGQA